jgi:hypothetical protein
MRLLPVLDAVEFRKRMTSGNSRPAVLLCEDGNGVVAEYVTKFNSEIFRHKSGFLYEACAALLAAHFGIKTPGPALIRLDEPLADALSSDSEMASLVRKNAGLNFGSRLISGYTTWPEDRAIPNHLRGAAADILAFDALIDNGNRTAENPNVLTDSRDIFLIDHELAFQFFTYGGGSPGDIDRAVLGLKDHPFYNNFRRRVVDFSSFSRKLDELSENRVASLRSCLPDEMNGPELDQIAQWLRLLRDERVSFLRKIQEVLL